MVFQKKLEEKNITDSVKDILSSDEKVISFHNGMVSQKINPIVGIQFGLLSLFFRIYNTYIIVTNKRIILPLYQPDSYSVASIISINWSDITKIHAKYPFLAPYELGFKTKDKLNYHISIYRSSYNKKQERENIEILDRLIKEKRND